MTLSKGTWNPVNTARRIIAGVGLLCLSSTGAAAPNRVVALRSKDMAAYNEALEGFRRAFSAKSPGCAVETVTLPGNPEATGNLMDNISRNPPDLVLAVGGSAARQARESLRSVPVVFCMVMKSETDLSYGGVIVDLPIADYLSQIRRTIPAVKTVGFIYNTSGSPAVIREALALQGKGLLKTFPASSPTEVDKIMKDLRQQVDCLFLWPDPVLFPTNTLGFFLHDAIQKGVPVVGVSPSFTKAGAIASFFPDFGNNGELAAQEALNVLEGQSVQRIPVLTPTKIKAGFNLPVAKFLNVDLDDAAVNSSTDVIR